MEGRESKVETAYKLSIPGRYLGAATKVDQDTWHPFLMDTDELLGLYATIKATLGLDI